MDQILESIIERLGDLELALLIDDYAQGKDSGLIDLVLVGDGPDKERLEVKSKQLGIDNLIEIYGPLTHEKLPFLYSSAVISVVPSIID